MIECKNCGRYIIPDNGFCEKCGQEISKQDIEFYEQKKSEEKKKREDNQKELNKFENFLDKDSKNIITFFKNFNLLYAILNLFIVFILAFGNPLFSIPIKLVITIGGVGYTTFVYMLIKLLIKHFSNVAQLKEITYKNFMKNSSAKDKKSNS